MNKNIIYTGIGKNDSFVTCVSLLIRSLEKFSTPTFDLLILYDEEIKEQVKSLTSSIYKIHTCKVHSITHSHKECFYKCCFYDFPLADSYEKALYLDSDILCTIDISTFFIEELPNETLSVFQESTDIKKHNEYYFNPFFPAVLSDDLIKRYTKEQRYVFNSGTFLFNVKGMRDHFQNVLQYLDTYKQVQTFGDQPFFNLYFNQHGLTTYHQFTSSNYHLGEVNEYKPNFILHFAGIGGFGNGYSKVVHMDHYWYTYLHNLQNTLPHQHLS